MRDYDFEELKREEMEVVNGGTSQVDNYSTTNVVDKVKSFFNNIKEYFRGN